MAESSDSNHSTCSSESGDDSFLSGSVSYSTEYSDDGNIPDLLILVGTEVLLYLFEPDASDNGSLGHPSKEPGDFDSSYAEWVGNIDW